MFVKKRFGTSPERHCLTAVPYRLFQGNLNPKDLKRHQIATQSLFFINDKGKWVANVGVTDAMWQKRGHSSKISIVFVISVDTGEILAYEIRSLVCHLCTKNYTNKNEQDFQE